MANEEAVRVHESSQTFMISGRQLKTAIYERVRRHSLERDNCLDKVATQLEEAAQKKGDSVAKQAASAMMSVLLNKNLTADSMTVKAQLDRTVFLTNEVTDLTCIAKNLLQDDFYKVSLDEAKRYGLL